MSATNAVVRVVQLADDRRAVRGDRRARARDRLQLGALGVDLHDVGRRDRARRDEAVDRDDRDVDLVAHVGVAAGRLEVRPARLADDEQPRAAVLGADRLGADRRVLEAVELDVARRPRCAHHGTGSNATTRPVGPTSRAPTIVKKPTFAPMS